MISCMVLVISCTVAACSLVPEACCWVDAMICADAALMLPVTATVCRVTSTNPSIMPLNASASCPISSEETMTALSSRRLPVAIFSDISVSSRRGRVMPRVMRKPMMDSDTMAASDPRMIISLLNSRLLFSVAVRFSSSSLSASCITLTSFPERVSIKSLPFLIASSNRRALRVGCGLPLVLFLCVHGFLELLQVLIDLTLQGPDPVLLGFVVLGQEADIFNAIREVLPSCLVGSRNSFCALRETALARLRILYGGENPFQILQTWRVCVTHQEFSATNSRLQYATPPMRSSRNKANPNPPANFLPTVHRVLFTGQTLFPFVGISRGEVVPRRGLWGGVPPHSPPESRPRPRRGDVRKSPRCQEATLPRPGP